MKKSNGRDSLERFRKWLDEGSDPLDMEMEDALSEPEEICSRDAEEPAWAASDAQFEHGTLGNRLKGMSRRAYYVYYSFLAVLVCAGLISVLLYATLHMPKFGGADTLVDSDLTAFYVENTLKDTGAQNVVTGIILNYRGFDTLGESHVLFSAVCTVLLMLRLTGNDERELLQAEPDDRHFEPKNDVILQTTARIVTPSILLFGIYVILNGHLSPGSGFSGGAIIGAGLILYLSAFGYRKTERFMNATVFKAVSASALMFYTLSKGYHFITACNDIPSGIGTGTPGNILSGGLLLPLNIAVGCVVAMTMYAMYTMFRKGDF